MTAEGPEDEVRALLRRAGIVVPAGDLPFLQRTLLRQRELLGSMREQVDAQTEPAHVFRPAD